MKTLPNYCNALLLDLTPDGYIQHITEVPFLNDSSIYVDKEYTTDQETYPDPTHILGFDDCEEIFDGGIISVEWEGYTFACMTENTYKLYYRRVK